MFTDALSPPSRGLRCRRFPHSSDSHSRSESLSLIRVAGHRVSATRRRCPHPIGRPVPARSSTAIVGRVGASSSRVSSPGFSRYTPRPAGSSSSRSRRPLYASSSIGRAADSKSAGCGFDSYLARFRIPRENRGFCLHRILRQLIPATPSRNARVNSVQLRPTRTNSPSIESPGPWLRMTHWQAAWRADGDDH
jgi:hypothetical protein